jgi:hypothetical protein
MAGRLYREMRRAEQLAAISSPIAVPQISTAPPVSSINRFALYPAQTPVSASTTLSMGGTPNLQELAYWKSVDGVPRPVTLVCTFTPPVPQGTDGVTGLYLRVWQGNERGVIAKWYGAPCVIPLTASFVRVDGAFGPLPYTVGQSGPPPWGGTSSFQSTVTTLLIDGAVDQTPPILLAHGVIATNANSPIVQGPAILTSLEFTNQGTTGVLMAWGDGTGGVTPVQFGKLSRSGIVYVPGQTSISVGANLLGPIASQTNVSTGTGGLCVSGIVSALTFTTTEDANDANVIVSAWGQILTPGSLAGT